MPAAGKDVSLSFTRLGLVVGVLLSIASLLGAFVVLPYRMDAAERRVQQIEKERATDHDLLMRIDERTAWMVDALGGGEKKLAPRR